MHKDEVRTLLAPLLERSTAAIDQGMKGFQNIFQRAILNLEVTSIAACRGLSLPT